LRSDLPTVFFDLEKRGFVASPVVFPLMMRLADRVVRSADEKVGR